MGLLKICILTLTGNMLTVTGYNVNKYTLGNCVKLQEIKSMTYNTFV